MKVIQVVLVERLEATIDEIRTTIYVHPKVGEELHEVARAMNDNAIHAP